MLKYKDYKLTKLSHNIEEQINKLIASQNGSIFHEPLLNKVISEKFNTELFYLVDNSQNIKSASVVHFTKNKFGFKRYNLRPLSDIPYSGFIGEHNVDFKNIEVGINESFSYVGFPYTKEVDEKGDIVIGETSMVDLTLSEDEIFKNVIHSKRRNMIRKALKSNISVRTFNTIDGLDLFWPILSELHQKLGYNHLDYNYYCSMLKPYLDNNTSFVSIAFKGARPISGVIILGNKNYMHYYKGASKMGFKNEGQGELLQWKAIKESKKRGSKFYDLCNISKEKLPQIYHFKTGISNNIYKYPIYGHSSFLYKAANRLAKII